MRRGRCTDDDLDWHERRRRGEAGQSTETYRQQTQQSGSDGHTHLMVCMTEVDGWWRVGADTDGEGRDWMSVRGRGATAGEGRGRRGNGRESALKRSSAAYSHMEAMEPGRYKRTVSFPGQTLLHNISRDGRWRRGDLGRTSPDPARGRGSTTPGPPSPSVLRPRASDAWARLGRLEQK